MSEELFGAIKFQHQNLLHLVDLLRTKNNALGDVIRQLFQKVKQAEEDKRYVVLLRGVKG
jgi:enoyl-CoA hydratase/carnithine racemase